MKNNLEMTGTPDVNGRSQILYISSSPTQKSYLKMNRSIKEFGSTVTYGMVESGLKFHNLILKGLAEQRFTEVHAVIGRALSKKYKGIFWASDTEEITDEFTAHHVSTINLPVLKQIWNSLAIAINVLIWRIKSDRSATRIVILDAAYVTAMPLVLLALAGTRAVISGIFADLYSYMANVEDASKRDHKIYPLVRGISQFCYKKLDAYIVITKEVSKLVNKSNKPFLVMEGIVDAMDQLGNNFPKSTSEENTIMYAGAIRREYGVEALIEGFKCYENKKASLVIYGAGKYVPEVIQASIQDKRISYGGMLHPSEILIREKRAGLLVSIRSPADEFTKYSFPSKIIEYLGSGTPVMSTRLKGIPEEYFEYLLPLEATEPEIIGQAFSSFFMKKSSERHELGKAGKEFVQTMKNQNVQGLRILEFLTQI